ncbi:MULTISPECIES: zf-HC2 domain-containing protein [Acidithrix]|uniref:Putative zinc-finger domain-containing protein n=1 Tax=Acidithrix ferrooxidans TaxID=1280514 RepID=A0A0D8HLF0_9ACTN|nr:MULTISPECIES: zf-HC2 domain-containing protein [Acidithrix]KJF18694.1 hypothetical protein AXFE_04260 [Acidithrix ferrooxidans]CAG4906181.1 unnamed protein product [Acidithrix sp. C25]
MNPFIETAKRIECMHNIRRLQQYLDGTLPEPSRRKTKAHLEVCRRCGLEATVYSDIKKALRQSAPEIDSVLLNELKLRGEQLRNQP